VEVFLREVCLFLRGVYALGESAVELGVWEFIR
jgi:hypothetical protein